MLLRKMRAGKTTVFAPLMRQSMTSEDSSYNPSGDRITVDPGICNGKPVVRGTRITVETILGYLSAGETNAEILKQYPGLTAVDITACLEFATRLVGHKFTFAKTA
jgi:uncharacterized protein (DUF433 family)